MIAAHGQPELNPTGMSGKQIQLSRQMPMVSPTFGGQLLLDSLWQAFCSLCPEEAL